MFFEEREKHKLVISNPALLVIDVQNYFFSKDSPAYLKGCEPVLERIKHLVSLFREKNLPVITTVHSGGSEAMKDWWGNIVDEQFSVGLIEGDIEIRKNTYDTFYNTNLEKILREKEVDQLFICGVMTHLCCETTARSAFVHSFKVVMVEDCLFDKNDWYHFSSLKSLAHGFAVISNLSEIENKLRR